MASGIAVLSVVGLIGTFALPSPFAATPGSAATSIPGQALVVETDTSIGVDALSSIGVVEIQAAPILPSKVNTEQGTVDISQLAETKLRYPFDQTMSLTDGFGYRTEPVAQFHDAQDIAAANGTPVRTIGDGVVTEAGWASDGCGFGLKVQHKVNGQGLTSRYCHMELDSHNYRVGDLINSGDQAGRVGNTGMSFGSHLHLALRLDGEPIDPLPYINSNAQ
ncbi:M23 family metallopeptidase [Leucobacter coleopterorum]|uniref:M23 family metallopeptidase n=1 Tax=Leucobacter coleopterorum TaxID=2714933 RepID=A0ABX6JZJ3_9MICO|nr:M23 family metallopeptidase [Leucobacter coleopterorum]